MGEAGSGIIVLLVPPQTEDGRGGVADQSGDVDLALRTNGIGAQILADLNVHDMVLLTQTSGRSIIGLEGYGLNVVGEQLLAEE